MSELTDKIRSRGHWDVAIRPEPFNENRVPFEELEDRVIKVAVRFRGWPVPFYDHREQPLRGEHWVGQDIDAAIVSHQEAWRYFTSGQFVQLRSVSADWREGNEATFVPEGFAAVIEVWEILFYLTEVFELATRLLLGSGGERVTINVKLHGLENRGLVVGDSGRSSFFEPYRSTVESLENSVSLNRDALVAGNREQAVEMARFFLVRFGWKPATELLTDYQRELIERA